MTPTAGGVVFFGDMGGNFYALDAETGRKLWGEKIGGAVGGGVITYAATASATSRRRDRPDRNPVADRDHHRQGVGARTGVAVDNPPHGTSTAAPSSLPVRKSSSASLALSSG